MKRFLALSLFLASFLVYGQAYFQQNSMVETVTSTVTSGGTTTLVFSSNTQQVFTGTSTQTVQLPATSLVPNGRRFIIFNRSTQTLTIQDATPTTIATIRAGKEALFTRDASSAWVIQFPDYVKGTGDTMSGSLSVTGNVSATSTVSGATVTATGPANAGTLSVTNQATVGSLTATGTITSSPTATNGEVRVDAITAADSLFTWYKNGAIKAYSVYEEATPELYTGTVTGRMDFRPGGTSMFTVGDGGSNAILQNGVSLIQKGSSSGQLTHAVPSAVTSYTLTWPSVQGGVTTCLGNDGSGNLSWVGCSGAGGFTGFADGTAAAPGGYFTSDTDTGLYRPTANTIGFSTGGSERARIDSSGDLKVGGTGGPIFDRVRVGSTLIDPAVGDTAASGGFYTQQTSTSPVTVQQHGSLHRYRRDNSSSVTDTASRLTAALFESTFSTGNGATYTNAQVGGVNGILIQEPLQFGLGTLAITNFSGLYIEGSVLNTGTNKYGIRIGDISGATNNYSIDTGLGLVRFGDEVRFKGSTSGYVGVKSVASPTSYTITLPSATPTVNDSVLTGTTAAITTWRELKTPTQQVFTSGSAATYTTPSGVKYLRVRMVAGGGGGYGANGSATSGGTGGNSLFGTSLLTANGGVGGSGVLTPGTGGSCTISSPAYGSGFIGADGNGGSQNTSALTTVPGGAGGGSCFGGAGRGGANIVGGTAKANSGSGGAGAGATASNDSGSGGGAGCCIDAIIPSPSASYTYTVGTSGAAGGGTTAGGAGAAGYIEVTEYYQ